MALTAHDKFTDSREYLRGELIEAQKTNTIYVPFLTIWHEVVNGRTSSLLNFMPDLNEGDYYEKEKET